MRVQPAKSFSEGRPLHIELFNPLTSRQVIHPYDIELNFEIGDKVILVNVGMFVEKVRAASLSRLYFRQQQCL